MSVKDEEHESLIQAIHDVAGNIRTLARDIEGGRTEPIERFDYVNNYAYDVLISLLAQEDYAQAEDCDDAPTEALREKANPILAGAGTTIDELYADARTGRRFLLQNVWAEMKANPQFPEHAGNVYDSFHYSLKFLGIEPRSPEMYALLGTDAAEFKRIDKAHALGTIYEGFVDNQMMTNIALGRIAAKHAQEGEAGKARLVDAFEQRFNAGINSLLEEMKFIMAQSDIAEEEVKFYVTTRMQMAGTLPPEGPAVVQ